MKKYILRSFIKIDKIEDKIYLVSRTTPSVKYAYLDPFVAVVVHMLNNCICIDDVAKCVTNLLHCRYEIAEEKVNNIIYILRDYMIEVDEDIKNIRRPLDIKDMLAEGNRDFDPVVQQLAVPKKISFNLTEYCPRQCIYCFNGAKYSVDNSIPNTFLSPARFKEVIDEVKALEIPFIEIGGGDPLIHPDILQYIEVLSTVDDSKKGISTKAYVSPEFAVQLRAHGLTEIQVSIDSLNPQTADKLMGVKNSYREIIESINNLRKAGVNVTIKAVITSLNVYEIPSLFEHFIDIGIKKILFNYYNFSSNRHSKKLFPTNDQLKWLSENMRELLKKAERKQVHTDYRNISYEDIRSSNCSMELKSYTRNQCGGMKGEFTVRYDGKVIFCPTICYCDDFVVGDLKVDGVYDIWTSQSLKEWDQPETKREKYRGTECYDCKLYTKCHFRRCYIRQYDANKQFFSKDPLCPYGDPNYVQFME